ncbi:MAG: DUF2934 domain-containing protein [Sulfuricella denitrificans]|nr:DUF2934 domain-containing protein [Sulfuricella denitrificans]
MAEAKTETATKAKKTAVSGEKSVTVKAAKPAPAAKPAKAATPRTTAKKVAAAKPATSRTSKAKGSKGVTPEQRYRMICDAAYFKAEKRNFSPENEIQDWLDAEAEINHMLGM